MGHQEAHVRQKRRSNPPAGGSYVAPLNGRRRLVSPLALAAPRLQFKLEVNEPGDRFEKQADGVADTVMRSPLPAATAAPPADGAHGIQRKMQGEEEPCVACDQNPRHIQRQEAPADETLQRQAAPDDEAIQRQEVPADETLQRQATPDDETVQRQEMSTDEAVQRQEAPDDETVQRDGKGKPSVSASTASTIRSPGPGNPIQPALRSRIEPHVGADLSSARVHTGPQAAQAASSLQARAFTFNNNIFLNRAESASDLRLMAHESTHVVQQGGAIRRKPLDESDTSPSASSALATAAPPLRSPASASSATNGAAASAATPSAPTPATPAAAVAPKPAEAVDSKVTAAKAKAAPAEKTEAAAAAEAPVAPAPLAKGAGVGPELLMPEPPDALSPAAEKRLKKVKGAASATAKAQKTMPSPEGTVSGARAAVTVPAEEKKAEAQQALVAELDASVEPSAEIEKLCERIREVIRKKRPPDEDTLVEAKPAEMAKQAGGELNQQVEGDTNQAQGGYAAMQTQPKGAPAPAGASLEATPAAGKAPAVNAAAATPDKVSAQEVSLDADVAASQQSMEKAGMMSESAQAVQDGPIAEARKTQGELTDVAEKDPAAVLAEQDAAIASSQADMAALQERALAALKQSRGKTTAQRESQQTGMVGSEEQIRAAVGAKADKIYQDAQSRVDDLLKDLPKTAMSMWDTGIKRESDTFKQSLAEVDRWIKKRHESTALAIWDAITGLPDWVTRDYNRAEKLFGDNVCQLMRDISIKVNSVIATSHAIIGQARKDIDALFKGLGPEMEEWAKKEQAKYGKQLDKLSERANATRNDFNKNMTERAAQAVQDVRTQIHGLREKAKGLIGRIADAIGEFIDDPIRAIINGLLRLVGIPPATFWALVARIQQVIADIADKPKQFANNLMKALKQGFSQFFENVGKHLLNGLLSWLFSGLGNVGITIPSDLSLKNVITFFLQLMGITWARIRRLLAKHIGEKNIAMIEQAWQLVSSLIQKGPAGIFEMLKDQLNPQGILDMILQMAVDFVKEALIKQVAIRILGMLNPVGAIAQAIELIYKLLKWLFQNAAKIFTLIETIVGGAADLIAGNVGGMAKAVEGALARIVPIVIDFLAGLLGLGDLPDKVAQAVKRLQAFVERILDKVIGFLANKAKALLAKLVRTGKSDEPDTRTPEQKQRDLNRAVSEAHRVLQDPDKTPREITRALRRLRQRYRLQKLAVVTDSESDTKRTAHVFGEVNPSLNGPPFATPLMRQVVITFYHRPWHAVGEYEIQLSGQERSLRAMTLREWWSNRRSFDIRKAFTNRGRDPASTKFQQSFRAAERERMISLQTSLGIVRHRAEQHVDEFMSTRVATHDPDQVAGGSAENVTRLGGKAINSSIGAQWPIPERGQSIKRWEKIQEAVQEIPSAYWDQQNVDVELRLTLNPSNR